MKDEQRHFLALWGSPPARLSVEQTAWVLNCQPHDIAPLIAARLLKPLGNPPPNGVKFFGTAEVLELTKDGSWLSRMSNAIHQYWFRRNKARTAAHGNGALSLRADGSGSDLQAAPRTKLCV